MTWTFSVFIAGGVIGLGAGIAWASAVRDAEKAEFERLSKELWKEITRLRAHVAAMIGRE